jgi:hypothetical protein
MVSATIGRLPSLDWLLHIGSDVIHISPLVLEKSRRYLSSHATVDLTRSIELDADMA